MKWRTLMKVMSLVIWTNLGASLPVERLCVSKVFHDALGAAAAPPPPIYLSRALRGEFRKKNQLI